MAEEVTLRMSVGLARDYDNAIADVMCWFHGFRAAHVGREDAPEMPPGWRKLSELNGKIKDAIGKATDDA